MNAQNSSGSQGSQSYASVTKTGIPPPLTKLLSHSKAQACQILIDKRSLQATNELKELTEVQLTTKAELTLKLMSKVGTTLPDNISFLSAKNVQNGGILYELNAPGSAKWINALANRSKFLNHFGTDIIIKEQVYQILLENIPISFNPNSKIALSEMECKGGLKQDNITKARYIKPIMRYNPNQRTAHIALILKTKTTANQIIHFKISVKGKKVYGHKLLPKPSRCLKCQTFNGRHIAADCPQEHNTCRTCRANHQTASCTIDIQELYHCANCNTDSHTSWSHECSIFITRWQENRVRNEEAKYKYFHTEDPNTWDKIKDKSNNYETDPLPPQILTQTYNNEWRTIHHQN
jgi:hypothetical protein